MTHKTKVIKTAFSTGKRRQTLVRVEGLNFRLSKQPSTSSKKIRYAVVGLGHIAQSAVLPAFAHAQSNSVLVGLISDDARKQKELSRRYKVPIVGSYADYRELLARKALDAVYIALPNFMHREFVIRAAEAGVHVLCEKPLGSNEKEAEQMVVACKRNRVKLMTAYRLHFERANLEAIQIVNSGKIGEPRYFSSTFSMQARDPNIRLKRKMAGGPLRDLGIYCINATRYLFRAEPTEVIALTASGEDERFREVEEMVGATLRFPGERIANFICSFGAADTATYEVMGTKGSVRLENAYEYVQPVEMTITIEGKETTKTFAKRDQFAPELVYFSKCIQKNIQPEPSGEEGVADLRIIDAIFESAKRGTAIKLPSRKKARRPSLRQELRRSPIRREPRLVKVQPGSR